MDKIKFPIIDRRDEEMARKRLEQFTKPKPKIEEKPQTRKSKRQVENLPITETQTHKVEPVGGTTKMDQLTNKVAMLDGAKGSGFMAALFAAATALNPEGMLVQEMKGQKLVNTDSMIHEVVDSLEKIDPQDCFITAGQSDEDNLFYAAIMKRNTSNIKGAPPYVILATNKVGYIESWSAKMAASKEYPLVPVLEDKKIAESPDIFVYPHYDEHLERVHRVKMKAIERRKRRTAKRQTAKEIAKAVGTRGFFNKKRKRGGKKR